ncbi:hypothetical protein MMC08_007734 [Hypocenomyce scalaris]|nr:hypothetical protein [Hypocenomyce scalaris]
MNNLATVLARQGKYEAAEEMLQQTLTGRRKVLGMEHPDTLNSMNNLAVVLEKQEKNAGMEHPDTLQSVHNLAYVCGCRSQYDDAEKLFQRACSGWEKILGPDHPNTEIAFKSYSAMRTERDDERKRQSQNDRKGSQEGANAGDGDGHGEQAEQH